MSNNITTTVLESAVHREQQRNPQLPDEDIYRKLVKTMVPAKVVGSPAYHRSALEDLKCIVHHKGIPDLFVTLTADESTDMRWQEVEQLEHFLQHWLAGGNWQDLPIENAFLFHHRLTEFMQRYITCQQGGILGQVKHWLVRYEGQVGDTGLVMGTQCCLW
jgi:hypothetical protein